MGNFFDYKVIKSDRRRTVSASIVDGMVVVRAPERMRRREIKEFVSKYSDKIQKMLESYIENKKKFDAVSPLTDKDIADLTERAKLVIPKRVAYYAPIVGVEYQRITIRHQRSRWGSCSAKGNLNFNCLLMLVPDEVLDSVVVHELCHLKEMNHSDRFYREVNRVMPGYDEHHRWLKENGEYIMHRLQKGENDEYKNI